MMLNVVQLCVRAQRLSLLHAVLHAWRNEVTHVGQFFARFTRLRHLFRFPEEPGELEHWDVTEEERTQFYSEFWALWACHGLQLYFGEGQVALRSAITRL